MPNTISDYSTTEAPLGYRRDALPQLLALLQLRHSVLEGSLDDLQQHKIARVECFRFDGELAEQLQPGRGSDYCCGLLAITADSGAVGFAEFALPCKSLHGDWVMWATPFHRMKGLSLLEGFRYAQNKQDVWGPARSELLATALLNLGGNHQEAAADREAPQRLQDRTNLLRHTQAYVVF